MNRTRNIVLVGVVMALNMLLVAGSEPTKTQEPDKCLVSSQAESDPAIGESGKPNAEKPPVTENANPSSARTQEGGGQKKEDVKQADNKISNGEKTSNVHLDVGAHTISMERGRKLDDILNGINDIRQRLPGVEEAGPTRNRAVNKLEGEASGMKWGGVIVSSILMVMFLIIAVGGIMLNGKVKDEIEALRESVKGMAGAEPMPETVDVEKLARQLNGLISIPPNGGMRGSAAIDKRMLEESIRRMLEELHMAQNMRNVEKCVTDNKNLLSRINDEILPGINKARDSLLETVGVIDDTLCNKTLEELPQALLRLREQGDADKRKIERLEKDLKMREDEMRAIDEKCKAKVSELERKSQETQSELSNLREKANRCAELEKENSSLKQGANACEERVKQCEAQMSSFRSWKDSVVPTCMKDGSFTTFFEEVAKDAMASNAAAAEAALLQGRLGCLAIAEKHPELVELERELVLVGKAITAYAHAKGMQEMRLGELMEGIAAAIRSADSVKAQGIDIAVPRIGVGYDTQWVRSMTGTSTVSVLHSWCVRNKRGVYSMAEVA